MRPERFRAKISWGMREMASRLSFSREEARCVPESMSMAVRVEISSMWSWAFPERGKEGARTSSMMCEVLGEEDGSEDGEREASSG